MAEFSKSFKQKVDCTNWDARQIQVARVLKVASCAQYIGQDDGRAEQLEETLYKRRWSSGLWHL